MTDLSSNAEPTERITRYIFNRQFIKTSYVEYGAFMPPDDGALSVARTELMSEDQVWQLGETSVRGTRQESLKGRADIKAQDFIDEDLSLIADGTPFKEHVSVVGWPDQESAILLKAELLAQKATPKRKPRISGSS